MPGKIAFTQAGLAGISSGEVIVPASTEHPNSARVVDQTKRFLDETAGREHKPDIVMHDCDTKLTKEFTQTLANAGISANPLPKASPNLIGRCERFIETIKLEFLNKFIIFGKRHLDHLLAEFTEYDNHHRSHRERDHLPPVREELDKLSIEEVEVKSYLGGLVKACERKAAQDYPIGSLLTALFDRIGGAIASPLRHGAFVALEAAYLEQFQIKFR